jgi:4-hydroxybenzoate polyprenyltransferase/phosphoserine phosphatase
MPESSTLPVLCVDLDGTLVATDTLHEALLLAVKRRPALALRIPFWLFRGKAGFKRRLTREAVPDAALLPYRAELLAWLKAEKAAGRRLCLITASDQSVADAVAGHLHPLFDEAWGSDGARNLAGGRKRDFLVARFGERGYDYAGDAPVDLEVWASARQAIVVTNSENLREEARSRCSDVRDIAVPGFDWRSIPRAMRVQQYAKNVLVFTVLIAAHRLRAPRLWADALLAFCSLCFSASAIYVLNDLLDLEADRRHPKKSRRPFASGELSLRWGLLLTPLCLVAAVAFAWRLHTGGQLLLLLYPVLSIAYSFYLKRQMLLDVFTLAVLYVVRVLIGASVTGILCSQWLMGFCIFLFLSLAFAKRASEWISLQQRHATATAGRAYYVWDLATIQMAGIASAFTAGTVLAFYIQSDVVGTLYPQPQWLWIFSIGVVFWLLRLWLVAARGQLEEDPMLFALRDRPSRLLFLTMLGGMALAWVGTPPIPGLR